MHWPALILIALLLVFLWVKRSGQIQVKKAAAYLKNGAMLVDVRTSGEFASGHLPNAVNVPLSGIESTLPRLVPDKHRVLLLHCQSGMRSGVAQKNISRMGYTQVFNLGSYARAETIVKASLV
jgi:rhodanese-related sulfurtransferase